MLLFQDRCGQLYTESLPDSVGIPLREPFVLGHRFRAIGKRRTGFPGYPQTKKLSETAGILKKKQVTDFVTIGVTPNNNAYALLSIGVVDVRPNLTF